MVNTSVRGLAAAVVLGTGVSSQALADAAGDYHGSMWHGGWGGMIFGPLMMILVVAVIVVLAVVALRWLGSTGHGVPPQAPPGKTPLDILKERFANGEIDREEFEERRRVLGD
jgi:putative membrane protein